MSDPRVAQYLDKIRGIDYRGIDLPIAMPHPWGIAVLLSKIGIAAIPDLIKALGDEDYTVRYCAADALQKIGMPVVPDLIAALKDENRNARACAATALGEKNNVSAIPALIEALKDTDTEVRSKAAEALERIGDISASFALIEALKDINANVRHNAAQALRQVGDVSAIPTLIEALQDEDAQVRYKVAFALVRIDIASSAPAVPALIEALRDKDSHFLSEYVHAHAASVLSVIGDVSAVPALIEALKYKSDARYSAASALRWLGDSSTLPRKILAAPQLSAQKRIEILDALRRVRSKDGCGTAIRYHFPDTRSLCEKVLKEENAAAREGAHAVLRWLDGDQYLVKASLSETATEACTLLRALQGSKPETQPETLLRGASEPEEKTEAHSEPRTLWERLFGNSNRRP